MKKLIIAILLFGFAQLAFSAELLVKAKPHWMDSLNQTEIDKMDEGQRQSYDARSQIGDIIVVRPDGWQWGREECLPNYVVVKVPDMTIEEAKKYEEQLSEEYTDELGATQYRTIRTRKHTIQKTIEDAKSLSQSIISKTKTSFESELTIKTGKADEVVAPKSGLISFYLRKVKPYISIAKTFWLENAWAATQLIKTVKPSGGDYTSLEACMDANEQDLVTADKYFDVEIDGDWSGGADTTVVTIENYVTDATRYINIYTTATARHSGEWSTSYYVLNVNNYGSYCIGSFTGYVTITGLQLTNTGGGSSEQCFRITAAFTTYDKNILQGFEGRGFYNYNAGNTVVKNCIVYDSKLAFDWRTGSPIWEIYNCTAVDNTTGVDAGNLTNCLFTDNGTDYAGGTLTTCASGDATGSAGLQNVNENTDQYNDYNNDDFHLGSSSDVIGAGTDLSGTFTDDIDGDTRSAWDIGADEYITVGAARRIILIN